MLHILTVNSYAIFEVAIAYIYYFLLLFLIFYIEYMRILLALIQCLIFLFFIVNLSIGNKFTTFFDNVCWCHYFRAGQPFEFIHCNFRPFNR